LDAAERCRAWRVEGTLPMHDGRTPRWRVRGSCFAPHKTGQKRGGHDGDRKNTSRSVLSIDGVPRSYRDQRDMAIEVAAQLMRRRGEGPAKRRADGD
jgi:hypothetical protein